MVLTDIPFELIEEEEMAAIEAVFLQLPAAGSGPRGVFSKQGPLSASSTNINAYHRFPIACGPTTERKPKLLKCSQSFSLEGASWGLPHGKDKASIFCISLSALSGSGSAGGKPAVDGELGDIEDGGDAGKGEVQAEEALGTLLQKRLQKGLAVTDFTALEWCEKQVEYTLTRGKPEKTAAMKAGSARHTELELEVVTRVPVTAHTREDSYAMRLGNFLVGAQQLRDENLTRELPVVGMVEGIWVVGIIDELRICERNGTSLPLIVDTKTRVRPTSPADPQKRNARMQLMLYKLLWDNMVTSPFSDESFVNFFGLDKNQNLSPEVQAFAQNALCNPSVASLGDFFEAFKLEVTSFSRSHDSLLLRYEWQADRSLIAEDEFYFQEEWLKEQLSWQMHYYRGQRDAGFVPKTELWKCRFCSFVNICPQNKSE